MDTEHTDPDEVDPNESPSGDTTDPRSKGADEDIAESLNEFKELDLTHNPDLTEEEIAEIRSIHENYILALKQEFESNQQKEPESVRQFTDDFMKKHVPAAAAQIVWLSMYAESETVKLNASKTIVSIAREQEDTGKNPIGDLINSLTKKEKAGK